MTEVSFDARLDLLVNAVGERIRGIEEAVYDESLGPDESADHLRSQKDLLVGAIMKIDKGDLYGLEPSEIRAVERATRYAVEHGQPGPELEALKATGAWFTEEVGSRALAEEGRPKLSSLEESAPRPEAPAPAFDFGHDR